MRSEDEEFDIVTFQTTLEHILDDLIILKIIKPVRCVILKKRRNSAQIEYFLSTIICIKSAMSRVMVIVQIHWDFLL